MLGEEACSTDGSVPGFNAPAGKRWALAAKLDHDNTVKEAAKLSRSNVFMDAGGDGLLHRTAWASARRGCCLAEFVSSGFGSLKSRRAAFYTTGGSRLMVADAAFGLVQAADSHCRWFHHRQDHTEPAATEINFTVDATNILQN